MAVDAHDIAFRDLSEQLVATLQQRAARGHHERLLPLIAVIELHLNRQEAVAAIRTRNVAKFAEKRGRCRLATRDASYLAVPVRGVIALVRRVLAPPLAHTPF